MNPYFSKPLSPNVNTENLPGIRILLSARICLWGTGTKICETFHDMCLCICVKLETITFQLHASFPIYAIFDRKMFQIASMIYWQSVHPQPIPVMLGINAGGY